MKLTLLCLFYVQFSQLGKSLPVSWRNNGESAAHEERKYKGQRKQDPCHVSSFKCPTSIALEEQGKSWGSSLMPELKTRNISVQQNWSELWPHVVSPCPGAYCVEERRKMHRSAHTTPSSHSWHLSKELERRQLSMLISDLPSHHGPAWWSPDYVWPLLIPPVLILIVAWGLSYMLDIPPASLSCLLDNLGSGLDSHACLPSSLAGGGGTGPG